MGPLKGRPAWNNVARPDESANHEASASDYAGGTVKVGRFAGTQKLPQDAPKNYEDKMGTHSSEQTSQVAKVSGSAYVKSTSPAAELGRGGYWDMEGGRGPGGY